MTNELTLVAKRTVLWEECVTKTWRVPNPLPWGDDWKATLSGCVRLIEENGEIRVELQVADQELSYMLTDTCFPLQYWIFKLEACFSNIELEADGVPKAFDIVIKGCVSAEIFGIPLDECVTLYRHHVTIRRLVGVIPPDIQAYTFAPPKLDQVVVSYASPLA